MNLRLNSGKKHYRKITISFSSLLVNKEVSLREYKRRRIVKWELHSVIICGLALGLCLEITTWFDPT